MSTSKRPWAEMQADAWADSRAYTPPPADAVAPPGPRGPCPNEGDVVVPCTSGNCGRDWRHQRVCKLLDPTGEVLLCVRGLMRPANSEVEVVSCQQCSHHPEAKPAAGPATPPRII